MFTANSELTRLCVFSALSCEISEFPPAERCLNPHGKQPVDEIKINPKVNERKTSAYLIQYTRLDAQVFSEISTFKRLIK